MAAPTSLAAAEKSPPADLDAAEISRLVEQNIPKRPTQIETEAERIRSSLVRLTSNSIDGLQGLTSELQELQRFLNAEVQRVQGEIESALAGIKIIVETIGPWQSSPASERPPTSAPPCSPRLQQQILNAHRCGHAESGRDPCQSRQNASACRCV